jgi:hypothetical protein
MKRALTLALLLGLGVGGWYVFGTPPTEQVTAAEASGTSSDTVSAAGIEPASALMKRAEESLRKGDVAEALLLRAFASRAGAAEASGPSAAGWQAAQAQAARWDHTVDRAMAAADMGDTEALIRAARELQTDVATPPNPHGLWLLLAWQAKLAQRGGIVPRISWDKQTSPAPNHAP